MNKKSNAVIGTGTSAEKYVKTCNQPSTFTFYNSSGGGTFFGQVIYPLSELKCCEFDQVVIAVYDYGELISMIDNVEQTCLYWFDATKETLTLLNDPYIDNLQSSPSSDSQLTLLYDMRVAPPTYDFIVFLVRGYLEAQDRGLINLRVIISPGDKDGFRENIDFFSHDEMSFRVTHLLLPLVKLVDKRADIFLCSNRKQARRIYQSSPSVFPVNHNFVKPKARHFYSEFFDFINRGVEHRVLSASEIYRERVREWFEYHNITNDKAITLTLRESTAHSGRNSELETWKKIALQLSRNGYRVIVVRDTSKALIPLGWDGIDEFPIAALDVEVRTALYEKSWLNLGVCNGPAVLCFLLAECQYLFFGMCNSSCTSNTYEHLASVGIVKGNNQVVGGGEGQYICWDDITVENVLSAIKQKFELS